MEKPAVTTIPLEVSPGKEEAKKKEESQIGKKEASAVPAAPAVPQRITEQGLNEFELIQDVDRNDPKFTGRWIGMSYKILKIIAVDDANYSFDIDFFVYPTWQEPKLIGTEKGKKFALSELPWEPKLKFKNDLDCQTVSESYWVSDPATGTIDCKTSLFFFRPIILLNLFFLQHLSE